MHNPYEIPGFVRPSAQNPPTRYREDPQIIEWNISAQPSLFLRRCSNCTSSAGVSVDISAAGEPVLAVRRPHAKASHANAPPSKTAGGPRQTSAVCQLKRGLSSTNS